MIKKMNMTPNKILIGKKREQVLSANRNTLVERIIIKSREVGKNLLFDHTKSCHY